jgi:hypothetical protein
MKFSYSNAENCDGRNLYWCIILIWAPLIIWFTSKETGYDSRLKIVRHISIHHLLSLPNGAITDYVKWPQWQRFLQEWAINHLLIWNTLLPSRLVPVWVVWSPYNRIAVAVWILMAYCELIWVRLAKIAAYTPNGKHWNGKSVRLHSWRLNEFLSCI